MPGTSREYKYLNDQPASTYFLHDHALGMTGRNIWFGLASLYIIKDEFWDSLNYPTGEYDVPLLIQDRRFNGTEPGANLLAPPNTDPAVHDTMSYAFFTLGEVFGDTPCVNGACSATSAAQGSTGVRFDVARRRYLLRLVNGSDLRYYRLAFQPVTEIGAVEPVLPMIVVASDGGLLPRSVLKRNLLMGPAERYAVIVDFSQVPLGTTVQMINLIPNVGGAGALRSVPNVMSFNVNREAEDTSSPPRDEQLPIERFDPEKADVRRILEFNSHESDAAEFHNGSPNNIFTINGREYDPARIDFRAKLGQTELWEVRNTNNITHTLHTHLVQFQTITFNGVPPSEELQGWKDTIFFNPGDRAEIMLKWEGFSGLYVFHCHMPAHEDHHMMLQVEIEP